jgi:hypothetical protein
LGFESRKSALRPCFSVEDEPLVEFMKFALGTNARNGVADSCLNPRSIESYATRLCLYSERLNLWWYKLWYAAAAEEAMTKRHMQETHTVYYIRSSGNKVCSRRKTLHFRRKSRLGVPCNLCLWTTLKTYAVHLIKTNEGSINIVWSVLFLSDQQFSCFIIQNQHYYRRTTPDHSPTTQ